MTDPKATEKESKKVYTYQDLIKFSNTEIYSGFGEMRDCVEGDGSSGLLRKANT